MARVLVTGANGFIGSHLLEHLLRQGHDVTGLIRVTSDLRNLEHVFRIHGDRLRLVVGDLRDPGSLASTLTHDIEFVYHLAAVLMGTTESTFRETNVHGTRNLLEAVKACCRDDFHRFLFTSSLAGAGPAPGPQPLTESDPPQPVSWYGASKRDAETVVRQYGDAGVPVTIVRPAAVYGEREIDFSRGTFPAVRLGLAPKIGLREKRVSFVYVEDLVRGIVAAAESEATVSGTYFLCDPDPYSDREVISTVADAMGKKVRIPVIVPHFALAMGAVLAEWAHVFHGRRPAITRDKVREVRRRYWAASPHAARHDFGWTPTIGLRDGMARAVGDWREREAAVRRANREPLRNRAIQTYTLAVALGVIVEGTAALGGWYSFHPWWLVFAVVLSVFGGLMGSISLAVLRRLALLGFVGGATVGIGAELLNEFWLHAWTFDPGTLGRLPAPWVRALVLGLPAGLMPLLLNAGVRALYRVRTRQGLWPPHTLPQRERT